MFAHSFHEGLPTGLKTDFDQGIFHDPRHLLLQASTGWVSFICTDDQTKTVHGLLYTCINHQEAKSPVRSPFGSFLFSEHVTREEIVAFIRFIETKLQQMNVKSFIVKHQPEAYSLQNKIITSCLSTLNYTVVAEETSSLIPVTENTFEKNLHRSEKKRLRKCRELGFTFETMPLEQLEKVYAFLEACREEKGYALSMPLPELQKLSHTFPERLLLTVVADQHKMVAANISIRVYDHVLYNFYHDHSSEYDHVSPVVLLNDGLYNFCKQHTIHLLDLGTSNPDGVLNESLLTFKLRLGALPSPKVTFSKHFS